MSCNDRWGIDGSGTSPHSLTHEQVEDVLERLEQQAAKKSHDMLEAYRLFLRTLPLDIEEKVAKLVGGLLPRPYQEEISCVLAELARREPLRIQEEILKFAREGRLDQLVDRERRDKALFGVLKNSSLDKHLVNMV